MPRMPVNAASITAAKPVAHGAVPHRIECCGAFKNRLLVMRLLEQHLYYVQRYLALQDNGALAAAAEYGWLAVWAHSPLFSGLDAASTATGRCIISAGAPPRPLTRFRF